MAPKRGLWLERFGRVAYYTNSQHSVAASEGPLLLLHGMHMRANAHEFTHLFEAFGARRPIYAPDLPGFGASDGGQIACEPELYVEAIRQFVELCASDALAPVDVVAVGLTCEHAARAVAALPDMVRSFAMIAPTGFATEREESALERMARRGTLLPMALLDRLGLTRALSSGFASVLTGVAFPKDNPEAAYTRVHCPTLVLHTRERRARYTTLARFVRWREHYRERELASVNLADRAAVRQIESALSSLFMHASIELRRSGREPSLEQAAELELRAG